MLQGGKVVTKGILRVGIGVIAVAAVALVVGAQGPSPDGGFGGPGPGRMGGPGWMAEGMFEFGGLMGGFGGKTVTGKPFQATFTVTRIETLPGNSIKNTTTGTVARASDGSTYRDAKFSAIGPWASSGKVHEVVYIRNLTKGMQYFVNVAKGTYESLPIREHHRPSEGKGGPKDQAAKNETVTDNPNATYTDPATNTVYNNVDDRKVTRTIPAGAIGNTNPIIITTERWYSNDLDVLLMETRSDPRFGTSSYQLANIGLSPASSLFVPDPSFSEVKGGRFGRGGRGGGPEMPPPPPPGD
jgi:hypothetical protein